MGLISPESSAVYWPLIQDRFESEQEFLQRNVAFVVRSPRAGSASLVKEIQRAVWSIDSEMPLADPTTVGELYTKSMARTSFTLVHALRSRKHVPDARHRRPLRCHLLCRVSTQA